MATSMPTTMRSLIQPSGSEPRVILTQREVPTANTDADEHLIRVRTVAPCAGELLWPQYIPPPTPRELVPCVDFAGTVVAAPDSSPFRPGDEVYARTDYARPGSGRDYTIAVTDELAHRPKHLSWAQATAIPVSAQTAWQALFIQSGVGDFASGNWNGKRVLVTAASGGCGAWTVQLAKLAGATVIGTCGPNNIELVESLGASEVVNYREVTLQEWSRTPGKKVDVVIDCAGGKALEDAWWSIRDEGAIISICRPPWPAKPEEHSGKNARALFFIMEPSRSQLETITKLVDEGKCRSRVDSVWPLEQFEESLKRADSGHARGKVILDLSLNNPDFTV